MSNFTKEEESALLGVLHAKGPRHELFMLRTKIATELFLDSIKTEEGARQAVEEADMLLKELIK